MKDYCDYFRGKKITIMGLGVLGRGVNIAVFLAECGADLTITDLKNEKELKPSLKKLKKFKNIKYVLGRHEFTDFKDKDFIIKAGGVPLDSLYIAEAKKNGIAIEMDESLFVKLAEGVVIIGITGTKGKSITAHLIFEILKSRKNILGKKRNVFLGGNVKGQATLPLLKKVNAGDIVVMELDSWRLQGFHDSKISPHISVFTTFMPDHMNYYNGNIKQYFEDKANIFKYQKEGDILILGENFLRQIKKLGLYNLFEKLIALRATTRRAEKETKGKIILSSKKNIPKNCMPAYSVGRPAGKVGKIKILGAHNLENIAAAVSACENLGIKKSEMKKTVENFRGDPGRLEFIKEIKGVKFYNDTTATTPESAIAAMHAFQNYKEKIILLGGGADKGLDYKEYARVVKKYVKALILFYGAASDKIIKELKIGKSGSAGKNFKIKIFSEVKNMRKALEFARNCAKKGNIVLLSPGAASFGVFKNEFDRGERFNKLIKKIY